MIRIITTITNVKWKWLIWFPRLLPTLTHREQICSAPSTAQRSRWAFWSECCNYILWFDLIGITCSLKGATIIWEGRSTRRWRDTETVQRTKRRGFPSARTAAQLPGGGGRHWGGQGEDGGEAALHLRPDPDQEGGDGVFQRQDLRVWIRVPGKAKSISQFWGIKAKVVTAICNI